MQEISERCWTNTTSRTEWSAPDPNSTKIYLSRKIYSPITLKAEGIMIVSIARKNIENLYQIMADSHQGTIFILSNKDSMITGDSSLLPVYYACKKRASTDLFQYDGVSYLFRQSDIVNITLHLFLKDIRPMLPPAMNHSIAVS